MSDSDMPTSGPVGTAATPSLLSFGGASSSGDRSAVSRQRGPVSTGIVLGVVALVVAVVALVVSIAALAA